MANVLINELLNRRWAPLWAQGIQDQVVRMRVVRMRVVRMRVVRQCNSSPVSPELSNSA